MSKTMSTKTYSALFILGSEASVVGDKDIL